HTGNYGASQNEMTIAISATKRGEVNIFPPHTGNYGASQNEMTIAISATKRGGKYFPITHRKLRCFTK
ncbi:MAG: hypothetical protein SWX82_01330, partial [Cyanobacteriota bacterium]|nr:hypothetical protein [Cyanobacteriota bacterium]